MASSSPGDLSMSFTQDSDEYREMHCEQCDLYNEKSTADGFCIECMEYMCNVCLKYHSRLSPGHRQQDKSTMPQDFCFEKCSRHTSKLIKYYCFTCKTFACYECKLRDHEQCNEIGHVPTVAKGVENSRELKDLFKDIKTFNTELERLNGRLEAKINQSRTQEKGVMTATNKQRKDTLKHVQEQKQLVTDTYDREIEITIEKLQAEKQEKINQISISQKQLDDKLTTVLNTIEKRQSTEKATLQRLKTKTEKVSSEVKDLALDIEQKQRSEERCNFFITMKTSEKTLENLQQEYMGLQKVTNEERTDDLTYELVAALNEFKALKKTYTLDFETTREEARRFGTLTSNLFVYEWNCHVSARANGAEHSALMHVLTWPPFPHFLTNYYPNRMNMLTEECVENLVKAVSMIENVVTKLSEGSLAVDIFRHISKPDSKFPELAELAQTKEIHTAASIRKEIEKQQEIKTCTTRVVNTIMRMVKTFDLKGDFTRIKVIADDSDLAVDSFDDSVITDHLENMTPAKERCLATFVNCKPLIQWLRMSRVASDVKRLQASVDLAFLSAGDEPINIARAQCFHSAVTGYAPLIRDLDESCGYKELLQLCSLVWKELETDPKLPAKLMDLNRLLQWLKATMEPDVTQMMHVEAICARGIFTIGKNAWKDDTSSQNIGETSMHVLADILKLSVPEQTDNRELKNWTFSEIQSLQRNLGKLEKYTENAVRFRMIVDGFTRMGIIYTKLCTAGCFLFKNWTARFHCDPDLNKGVCVVLQFGFENVDQQLQGRMTKTGDILDMILDIAKFMEVCFAEWLLYIKEARRRCSELNHFTNDQLFILQKELGKVGTDSEPSELVYPMLSFLKDNCSPGDLLEAMADAQKTLNIPLTNRAIEEVDPEDTRAGSVWSMDHEKEVMDNYKPLTQSDEQIKKQPQQVDIHTLITTLITKLRKESSVGSGPLIQNLNALWRDFLQALSFSFRDCLSLKHIAIILSILEKKNTTYINRSLHTVFKEDQPNLVICEDESVFITALTVYMADKDQPLPQPDEVLTCTKETKTDEIDMFLRRVFYSGSKKIYCLVNADMLTYNVDEYTERCVEEYLKETHAGSSYRLIVISGCNKQSGFLASLNKFKRQPLQISTEAVREYLLTKLSVQENSSTRLSPAAVADRERSTVRVIKSWQAGAGKSLCVERMKEKFPRVDSVYIALNGISICPEEVIKSLLPFTLRPNEPEPRIFHIDIYHEVENGVDNFLFNLLILGCLRDKTGLIWRRSLTDIFLIENTPLLISVNSGQDANWRYVHSLLSVLPNRTCRSPKECLCIYKGILPQDYDDSDQLFDDEMYRSDVFQRPYRYLMRTDKTKVQFKSDIESCLQTILRHCGLEEPSWRDVHYFVMFLNRQLIAFENNPFVGEFSFKQGTDFSVFVLEFLLKMSRDFATRSLRFTDESNQSLKSKTNVETEEMLDGLLDEIQLKHKWEDSRHPCLLFNSDNTTFTFLGFHVEPNSGHLIDPLTRQVLELRIMNSSLHSSLVRNGVSLSDDFDSLSRHDKIMRLCIFMGIQYPHDPDENFILTTDIVKKIMAIHMRFRYDLPTLIMGETGYGKTRLVKFLCDIQLPSEYRKNTTNMIRVKVHGSPSKDIIKAVRQAEQVAEKNRQEYGDSVHTVLFFDGVNVTKDIGLIKEIMCEGSLLGKKLNKNLKIISACNPYRRHSDKMMKEMEQEGFGGHMDTNDANVLPGHLPLQCLVYKVYPLPHSLLPLVWDFGRLEADVENVFINQIVKKYIRDAKLPDIPGLAEVVSAILAASQDYMKKHMDEYCVVSLRNVERALTVMSWFYQNSRGGRTIFCLMDEILRDENKINDVTRSLILALGVCYHACLKEREHYRTYIAHYFRAPCHVHDGEKQIMNEIKCCQEVFFYNCHLERDIARTNKTLMENVFIMVVCIELRIPLFLVGRPGSSKSLAKTILFDAMLGNASRRYPYRELKQAQMVTFQCSPITAKSGIENAFSQCAQLQRDKDLDTFVSVVVLDDMDMADNSTGMPLQTLPQLLDDGVLGLESPATHKKVAFIGISGHVPEPALVNRGVIVQTEVPDLQQLKDIASSMCISDSDLITPLIEPMAKSYLEIVETTSKTTGEFFGLRDFYRFLKTVFNFTDKSRRKATWHELLYSIKRNFGGLDSVVAPAEILRKNLTTVVRFELEPRPSDPDCTLLGLVQTQLQSDGRYLLLMTENYGSLNIIQQTLFKRLDIKYITMFGSSFPGDQKDTKVCLYLEEIKYFMQNGSTVVLLNLERLYGSLQDALNQYYIYFGGERYVDLGLPTHRIKCPVHKNFRLIVVEEKNTVYKKFPKTLLSRFEKHVFTHTNILPLEQIRVAHELEDWVKTLMTQRKDIGRRAKVEDVFIGYNGDTCASVVLDIWDKHKHLEYTMEKDSKVLREAKSVLLWCATPELLERIDSSSLSNPEKMFLKGLYLTEQAHDSLIQYLNVAIVLRQRRQFFTQITTHSKLISAVQKTDISKATEICAENISILRTLTSFETEEQFVKTILQHIQRADKDPSLLFVQCDAGDENDNLIAFARYCVTDQLEKMKDELRAPVHVVLIIQLQRGTSYTGFQCGLWHSVHIDDLKTEQI